MYKVDFVFTKKGALRYISHLDLMRLLIRALRRSGIPLKMTEGFSPHPKMSIRRALKLGLESEHEEACVFVRYPVSDENFRITLQKQLPKGIEVKDVKGNLN